MPPQSKGPSYLPFTDRHGKRRARARIPLGGGKYRDISLGLYGSTESRARFRKLCDEWEASRAAGVGLRHGLLVSDLAAAFMGHAELHYRQPDGKPTSELRSYVASLRLLLKLHGDTAARDFGPLALKAVRMAMIDEGQCRKTINQSVGRIRRAFKWATSEQLIPVDVFAALQTVQGLAQGRSKAPDRPPVPPAPQADVEAAVAQLGPALAAMVRVQQLAGMRPQDVCGLTAGELDRPGLVIDGREIWVYRPARHKTAWRGHTKAVAIGPRAQEILLPFIAAAGGGPLFFPRRRGCKPYSVGAYSKHVLRACRRAGVSPWHPNQLRHSAATAIQQEFGLDAARAVLGHNDPKTTLIYAERNLKQAAEIAAKIG